MDSTTKDKVDPVFLAWNDLEDAIFQLTATLEYEWGGEFRKEIEELNTAYIRFRAAKVRMDRAINS